MKENIINLDGKTVVAYSQQNVMRDEVELVLMVDGGTIKLRMNVEQRDYLLSRLLYTSEDKIRNVWEALHHGKGIAE